MTAGPLLSNTQEVLTVVWRAPMQLTQLPFLAFLPAELSTGFWSEDWRKPSFPRRIFVDMKLKRTFYVILKVSFECIRDRLVGSAVELT